MMKPTLPSSSISSPEIPISNERAAKEGSKARSNEPTGIGTFTSDGREGGRQVVSDEQRKGTGMGKGKRHGSSSGLGTPIVNTLASAGGLRRENGNGHRKGSASTGGGGAGVTAVGVKSENGNASSVTKTNDTINGGGLVSSAGRTEGGKSISTGEGHKKLLSFSKRSSISEQSVAGGSGMGFDSNSVLMTSTTTTPITTTTAPMDFSGGYDPGIVGAGEMVGSGETSSRSGPITSNFPALPRTHPKNNTSSPTSIAVGSSHNNGISLTFGSVSVSGSVITSPSSTSSSSSIIFPASTMAIPKTNKNELDLGEVSSSSILPSVSVPTANVTDLITTASSIKPVTLKKPKHRFPNPAKIVAKTRSSGTGSKSGKENDGGRKKGKEVAGIPTSVNNNNNHNSGGILNSKDQSDSELGQASEGQWHQLTSQASNSSLASTFTLSTNFPSPSLHIDFDPNEADREGFAFKRNSRTSRDGDFEGEEFPGFEFGTTSSIGSSIDSLNMSLENAPISSESGDGGSNSRSKSRKRPIASSNGLSRDLDDFDWTASDLYDHQETLQGDDGEMEGDITAAKLNTLYHPLTRPPAIDPRQNSDGTDQERINRVTGISLGQGGYDHEHPFTVTSSSSKPFAFGPPVVDPITPRAGFSSQLLSEPETITPVFLAQGLEVGGHGAARSASVGAVPIDPSDATLGGVYHAADHITSPSINVDQPPHSQNQHHQRSQRVGPKPSASHEDDVLHFFPTPASVGPKKTNTISIRTGDHSADTDFDGDEVQEISNRLGISLPSDGALMGSPLIRAKAFDELDDHEKDTSRQEPFTLPESVAKNQQMPHRRSKSIPALYYATSDYVQSSFPPQPPPDLRQLSASPLAMDENEMNELVESSFKGTVPDVDTRPLYHRNHHHLPPTLPPSSEKEDVSFLDQNDETIQYSMDSRRGSGEIGLDDKVFLDEEAVDDDELEDQEIEGDFDIQGEEEEGLDESPLYAVLSKSNSPLLREAWEYARMVVIPPRRTLPLEILELQKELEMEEKCGEKLADGSGPEKEECLGEEELQRRLDQKRCECYIALHAFAKLGLVGCPTNNGDDDETEGPEPEWMGFATTMEGLLEEAEAGLPHQSPSTNSSFGGRKLRLEASKQNQSRRMHFRLVDDKFGPATPAGEMEGAEDGILHPFPSLDAVPFSAVDRPTTKETRDLSSKGWRQVNIVGDLQIGVRGGSDASSSSSDFLHSKSKKDSKSLLKRLLRTTSSKPDKASLTRSTPPTNSITKSRIVKLVGVDSAIIDWRAAAPIAGSSLSDRRDSQEPPAIGLEPGFRPRSASSTSPSTPLSPSMSRVGTRSLNSRSRPSSIWTGDLSHGQRRTRSKATLPSTASKSVLHFGFGEQYDGSQGAAVSSLLYLLQSHTDGPKLTKILTQIFDSVQAFVLPPVATSDAYARVCVGIRASIITPNSVELGGGMFFQAIENVTLALLHKSLYTKTLKRVLQSEDARMNKILAAYASHETALSELLHEEGVDDISALETAVEALSRLKHSQLGSPPHSEAVSTELDTLFSNKDLGRFPQDFYDAVTPLDIFLTASRALDAVVRAFAGKSTSPDALNASMVYAICKSGVENFCSLISYAEAFQQTERSGLYAKLDYSLTTIQVALGMLDSDPLNLLPELPSLSTHRVRRHSSQSMFLPQSQNPFGFARHGSLSGKESSRRRRAALNSPGGQKSSPLRNQRRSFQGEASVALTRALSTRSAQAARPQRSSLLWNFSDDGHTTSRRVANYDTWNPRISSSSRLQRNLSVSTTDTGSDESWWEWGRKRVGFGSTDDGDAELDDEKVDDLGKEENKPTSRPGPRARRNSEAAANVLHARREGSDPTDLARLRTPSDEGSDAIISDQRFWKGRPRAATRSHPMKLTQSTSQLSSPSLPLANLESVRTRPPHLRRENLSSHRLSMPLPPHLDPLTASFLPPSESTPSPRGQILSSPSMHGRYISLPSPIREMPSQSQIRPSD